MVKKKELNKAHRAALVVQARAGLIPASDEIANEIHARMERTARTCRSIKAYAKLPACGSDARAISDILTDLLHYCASMNLDFHELEAAAYQQYEDEVALAADHQA